MLQSLFRFSKQHRVVSVLEQLQTLALNPEPGFQTIKGKSNPRCVRACPELIIQSVKQKCKQFRTVNSSLQNTKPIIPVLTPEPNLALTRRELSSESALGITFPQRVVQLPANAETP